MCYDYYCVIPSLTRAGFDPWKYSGYGQSRKGTLWNRPAYRLRPKASTVLQTYLRQRDLPPWTAFFIPYKAVQDDQFGFSHFNFTVSSSDQHTVNYHVLRTGAYPYIKYHCTARPWQDLTTEDRLYRLLKITNLGLPCLLYGIAGLLFARHYDYVRLSSTTHIRLRFWYKEDW